MKAITNKLNAAQLRIINHQIRENVANEVAKIQLDLDAVFLLACRKTFGLGPKRLRRLYQNYFEMRREFMEFYESDGFDGAVDIAADMELKNAGFDVKEIYKEIGDARIDYSFSKTESRALRDAQKKAAERDAERAAQLHREKLGAPHSVPQAPERAEEMRYYLIKHEDGDVILHAAFPTKEKAQEWIEKFCDAGVEYELIERGELFKKSKENNT